MGIKGLTQLINENVPAAIREHKIKHYGGRKIAIDASGALYQFLIAVRPDGTEMTDAEGNPTAHLQGMFYRTKRLLANGIKPVYVFDGKPPDMKRGELAKRRAIKEKAEADLAAATEAGNAEEVERFARRTVRVTKEHNLECQRLLTLMGVPWVVAPSEAETQCVELCKANKVYAVASEDLDVLTSGGALLLRHMTFSAARKKDIAEYHLDILLQGLEFTFEQFIDLCILCGCDYLDPIRGVGKVTALKLMREHGSIEAILENIDRTKYKVPEDWDYQAARVLFRTPEVTPAADIKLQWQDPDQEGLKQFLVEEKGFDAARMDKGIKQLADLRGKSTQSHLDSFFGKPTITINKDKARKAKEAAKAAKRAKSKKKRKSSSKNPRATKRQRVEAAARANGVSLSDDTPATTSTS